jgi:hypothetical protein
MCAWAHMLSFEDNICAHAQPSKRGNAKAPPTVSLAL